MAARLQIVYCALLPHNCKCVISVHWLIIVRLVGRMHRPFFFAAIPLASLVFGQVAFAAECTFPNAEEAGCVCTLAIDPGQTGPIAQLSDIVGDVLVTAQTGFTAGFSPVGDVVDLYAGDGVAVPADGAAVLNFGPNCRRELAPNTSLVIRRENGCACAAIFGIDAPAVTGATEQENTAAGVLFFGTTLAATITFLLTMDGGGDSVSP